jgi:hypothetical protein
VMVPLVTRVTGNARDKLGKSAKANGSSDKVVDLVESKVKGGLYTPPGIPIGLLGLLGLS